MRDSIIIGKGPAGISCAIYLKRANLNPLVLGHSFGALEKDTWIENYYGFDKISGKDLIQRGIDQAINLNIEVKTEEVIKIIDHYDYFTVVTTMEEYDTKTIIMATGKKRNELKIKNYQKFLGKGISYCATCDGFIFKNKKIGVVGNSDYAASEYHELKSFSQDLKLFTNGLPIRFEMREEIPFEEKLIVEARGTEKLESIVLSDGSEVPLDALFVAIGVSSGADFARHLGIDIDSKTQNIMIDENFMTNIRGIFAIGDIIGGTYQIAKAVSDGCVASKKIIEYIKKEGSL